MRYDTIKDQIRLIIKQNRLFQKIFFLLLDFFILRQWYIKKELKKYLSNDEKFLFYDAGAGFCQYSDYVFRRYNKVSILSLDLKKNSFITDLFVSYNFQEINKKKVDNNRLTKAVFIKNNLENFYLDKEKADLIIAIDVLEHIDDDIAVLSNFYISMKDNAVIIISTPSNFDNASSFADEHIRPGYSIDELIRKVKSVGFNIVEHKYSYGYWGNLYWKIFIRNCVYLLNISNIMWVLIPFYLLIVFIPCLIFMLLDFSFKNKKGNGIILIAKKISKV